MDPDELYGLPFERFVPERNALARALRADGRREDATEVARLRKPSVAAWAVNQLVRTQKSALAELLEAGDAMREAQAGVIAGSGDAGSLRAGVERERSAVAALISAARGLLSSDGHELSDAVLERVTETLHAAAFDVEARAQVRDGRLVSELQHVGLGVEAANVPARRASRPRPAKRTPEPSEPDRRAARRATRIAQSQARQRAERAARALAVAQERRDRAAKQLSDAEQALVLARAEADAAADAYRSAQDSKR